MDFRAIFLKRFNEYRDAFVSDINEEGFYVIGSKMCECFGVSNKDPRCFVPAMKLFVDNLKVDEEYFCGIMKRFKIDETSKFKFDVKRLIRDAEQARKQAAEEAKKQFGI